MTCKSLAESKFTDWLATDPLSSVEQQEQMVQVEVRHSELLAWQTSKENKGCWQTKEHSVLGGATLEMLMMTVFSDRIR